MSQMNLLVIVIVVQLFYAASITGIAYFLPEDALNYVSSFSDLADEINLQSVSTDIQNSLESQTNIPVIEIGALVFYSGNILIDLFFNFMTATPQMIILLIQGITTLFSVNVQIMGLIQLFLTVIMAAMYLLGLINLLVNVRSGRVI